MHSCTTFHFDVSRKLRMRIHFVMFNAIATSLKQQPYLNSSVPEVCAAAALAACDFALIVWERCSHLHAADSWLCCC